MSMVHLLMLAVHLLATIAKLLRPGEVRAIVAESLLLRYQLVISSRARRRAPNLNSLDRFVLGLGGQEWPPFFTTTNGGPNRHNIRRNRGGSNLHNIPRNTDDSIHHSTRCSRDSIHHSTAASHSTRHPSHLRTIRHATRLEQGSRLTRLSALQATREEGQ